MTDPEINMRHYVYRQRTLASKASWAPWLAFAEDLTAMKTIINGTVQIVGLT